MGSFKRQRLHDLIATSQSSGTSTILSGRAGTGKTVLALDFAEKSGRAVSWYKVDAPDSEMRIFFQYLIASIRTQRPQLGAERLVSLLQQTNTDNIPNLAEAFVYELELVQDRPLLIVIDDLHLVCDAKWLVPFFRRLLPLLPSDVHMLITSRTIPPAPLWRMRSKQTLFVIDEETLAFTRAEALTLFQHHGLTPEQASIALDHSRGRAAAIANLAATLRFAEASDRDGPAVFDISQPIEAV
jgi:LuxR family maltose regulon positive regulatory protein